MAGNVFNLVEHQVTVAALGLLEHNVVLPGLIYKYAGADFKGTLNDTVNVKRPSRAVETVDLNWRPDPEADGHQAARKPSDIGKIAETKIPVKLNKFPSNSIVLTDEQLTLDIANFGAQVLQPQVRGLVYHLEDAVAAFLVNLSTATKVAVDLTKVSSPDDPIVRARAIFSGIVDARKALDEADVPPEGRKLVITPDVEAIFLKNPDFTRIDVSGDTSALRQAVVGRLYGFDVIVSNSYAKAVKADASGAKLQATAFVSTCGVLACQAPNIPQGAKFGSSQVSNGMSLRWMMDYDTDSRSDRSSVDTFYGLSSVAEDDGKIRRAVQINITDKAKPAGK